MRQLYYAKNNDASPGEYLAKAIISAITIIPLVFILHVTEFKVFLLSTMSVIGSGCFDLYVESKNARYWLKTAMQAALAVGVVMSGTIIGALTVSTICKVLQKIILFVDIALCISFFCFTYIIYVHVQNIKENKGAESNDV